MADLILRQGTGFPLGVYEQDNGIQFTMDFTGKNNQVIISDGGKSFKVPFGDAVYGNIYSVIVCGINPEEIKYTYISDGVECVDKYANTVLGNEKYGIKNNDYHLEYKVVNHNQFDWEETTKPQLEFKDMILYLLHVRGFSNHKSSHVKNNGTFEGIVEKIDYLKDLGVNSIELMPSYEFEEYEFPSKKMQELSKVTGEEISGRINYWGYKEGFYYSPKSSYSAINDPVISFKNLVKEFHKNSMEVIMQFYFPDSVKQNIIVDILKFWVINYKVDGFHLKGNKIPVAIIANDSFFADTKIFHHYIPENEIYDYNEKPEFKHLCVYTDNYMYSVRKTLKGDEGCMKDFSGLLKNVPDKCGNVNFITNYYGFTLNDLVSYDRKHNEANGENNCDGSDYNYSWNCGIEGKSKKIQVNNLRKKMMKNAILTLMTSKGVPVIYSGDEFCNSQEGNNNPYCQDNDISYVQWNTTAQAKEIFDFTRQMIKFRTNELYPMIQKDFTMLDQNKTGFPDLSFHTDEAWKSDFASYNRHLGIMYSDVDKDGMVSLIFVAYNFYWKEITFSLPNLPNDVEWKVMFSTGNVKKSDDTNMNNYELENRSCAVFNVRFDKKLINR